MQMFSFTSWGKSSTIGALCDPQEQSETPMQEVSLAVGLHTY